MIFKKNKKKITENEKGTKKGRPIPKLLKIFYLMQRVFDDEIGHELIK